MKHRENEKVKKESPLKSVFKWGDVLLLLVVILAVVLTVVLATGKQSQYAQVFVDGNLKYQLDLSNDTTLDILDGAMTIRVQNGKVFVAHSDCEEQLCVHASAIGKNGGMIVCLPNKVVIKTVSKKVDAIT